MSKKIQLSECLINYILEFLYGTGRKYLYWDPVQKIYRIRFTEKWLQTKYKKINRLYRSIKTYNILNNTTIIIPIPQYTNHYNMYRSIQIDIILKWDNVINKDITFIGGFNDKSYTISTKLTNHYMDHLVKTVYTYEFEDYYEILVVSSLFENGVFIGEKVHTIKKSIL